MLWGYLKHDSQDRTMVIGLAKEAIAELIEDKCYDFQLFCKKFSIHLLMQNNTCVWRITIINILMMLNFKLIIIRQRHTGFLHYFRPAHTLIVIALLSALTTIPFIILAAL